MITRFFLSHTEEVAYNDSGNIETDLNWVTSNSSVASLRNTYSADMVSLITNNGGGYCGIGWVQRNPGSGFAGYAFQVTWLACLSNSTLAHEHGHNMGMEHDPASAGISPSGASYPWSFGHYVNGAFRTIMSYDVCSISCPRVLHYSNPDVLYNGIPTGILNQRDNAQTGDLTAPIVANFRAGGGSGTNNPPAFTSDPIVKTNATQGLAYSGSVAGNASDPDADPLTFAKTSGPAWRDAAARPRRQRHRQRCPARVRDDSLDGRSSQLSIARHGGGQTALLHSARIGSYLRPGLWRRSVQPGLGIFHQPS